MKYHFRIGKITITMQDILMLVFLVFFMLKMLRAFSGSSVQGGIWNYIQLGFVFLGSVFFVTTIPRYLHSGVVISLFLYTLIAMVNSLFYVTFTQPWLFDYLTIPYMFCIMMIAFADGRYYDIEENKMLLISFFILAGIFIYSMLSKGIYSTRTGAVADVYYILCLLPLMLVYFKKFKLIPMAITGVAILISGKRTGIVIFVLMVIAYYVTLSIQSRSVRTYAVSLLALAVVIAAFVITFRVINSGFNGNLLDRLTRMIEDQDSSGRYERWEQVLKGFNDSSLIQWLIGHGNGAVSKDFGGNAHNDFLEILYDYGIFALTAFISFVVFIVVELIKMLKDRYVYAPQFLMAVICSFGLSNFSFYVIMPTYITAGMLAMGFLMIDYQKRCHPLSPMVRMKQT